MSLPGEREIPIRKEFQTAQFQNLLLSEIANTGTYQNTMIKDLRPLLDRVREAHEWFQGKPELPAIETEIDFQHQVIELEGVGEIDRRLTRYIEFLDSFTRDTLGLRYDGEAAYWAREAIHWHALTSQLISPLVPGASWGFWRDFTMSVRVTDGYARVEARDHFGSAIDSVETNAPAWTSFNDWNDFTETSLRLFRKHLHRLQTEARDEYRALGMNRRMGGLKSDAESVKRLAKIIMATPRNRSRLLLQDPEVINVKSEKQRIRNLCALIRLDSPFQRQQKIRA